MALKKIIKANSRELTKKKREEILTIIRGHIGIDDRLPEVVIQDDFNGDENSYLLAMAELYDIRV